jgi:hypothetical protein
MKGIVIHHENGIRRAIEGKVTQGRLSVRPILAVAPTRRETTARPISFVFYEDGRVIAKSSRVLVTSGRRYPGVEHWFVLPEGVRQPAPADPQYAPAAL